MAKAFGAFPELRHPFEPTPIHPAGHTTVLYQGRTIQLSATGPGDGLLIRPEDLASVNGFVLKPEGACFQDLCFPLKDNWLIERGGKTWFDLTAFANTVGQHFIADEASRVWSFAEIPAKQDNMLVNGMAPDFEIVDRTGNVIRTADYRGKKALIVTWSSW